MSASTGREDASPSPPADAPAGDGCAALPSPVDLAPVGLAYADAWGAVIYANEQWRRLLGCDGDLPASLDELLTLAHPEDRDSLANSFTAVLGGQESRMRFRPNLPAERQRDLAFAVRRIPRRSDDVRYVGVLTDVTELTDALEEVRRSEERFRSVTTALPVCVFRTDTRGAITWVNGPLHEMTGYDLDAVRGRSVLDFVHHDDQQEVWERVLAANHARQPYEAQHRFVCRDGSVIWVITRSAPVHDEAGSVVEHVGSMEDVTDLHARSEVLAHAAAHDPLTRLPNRANLEALLESLHAAAPGRDDIGIVFVDLDRFKEINDEFGHHAGDAVLVEVGHRIQSAVRSADTVCRLAGDEFVVVCPEIAERSLLEEIASRVTTAIGDAPVERAGDRYSIGASAGIALGPGERTIADLLRDADEAMFAAKRERR